MIHAFKRRNQRIVLDSASGAVHVLSALAYKMIDYLVPPLTINCPTTLRYDLAKYDSADVDEAYAELYGLYKDGMLFADDINVPVPPARVTRIKSLCLHIAHDCNMRCKYCFADTGDYHRSRSLMSAEVGKKAIDFLMTHSGTTHNLEVDFFGGEPLMNFEVVKEIAAYGRKIEKEYDKNIRFTMTTNCSLLDDESIEFINRECHNVVLSIDGRKKVNDEKRIYEDGSGTFDDILPKIHKLVDARGNRDYYVRGTFTRDNLDFANDVLFLADEGFTEISVEPVVLPQSDPMSIRKEDLPAIFAEYDRLADEIIKRNKEGKPFNFFHFMLDLDAGPCAVKRTKGCGSGTEYIAITPEGDIYPCHQFAEHVPMKLGNVCEDSLRDDIRDIFAECNICKNATCRECWAKYFCGGGCAANNYKYSGSVNVPYEIGCELERKRVECALYIKAALAE